MVCSVLCNWLQQLLFEAEADWYEGNNENYRNRRHLAGEIMKTLGCTYDEKQVGMFLWGKIPASCKDVEELTEKVLHEARVFITPDLSSAVTEQGISVSHFVARTISWQKLWKELKRI